MKKSLILIITIIIITIISLVTVSFLLDDKDVSIEPKIISYYEFGKPTTLSSTNYLDVITKSKVFAKLEEEQLSVCIYINSTLECFKNNNYDKEQIHLKNIFGTDNCILYSEGVGCNDENFACNVYQNGEVFCVNLNSSYSCDIHSNNYVDCLEGVDN